jgi:hypothetical protein
MKMRRSTSEVSKALAALLLYTTDISQQDFLYKEGSNVHSPSGNRYSQMPQKGGGGARWEPGFEPKIGRRPSR